MTESLDDLIEETSKHVRVMSLYPKLFKRKELQHLHEFMDRALYNSLCLLDTLVALKHLRASIESNNEFEANYFARITALHVRESLDNLNNFHGKNFRDSIADMVGQESLIEIDAWVKALKSLKKRCFPMLTEIRHNVIAHKTANGLEQVRVIRSVDAGKIGEIGWEAADSQFNLLAEYVRLIERLP